MSNEEQFDVDIALPEVDPAAIYHQTDVAQVDIERTPFLQTLPQMGRFLSASARWLWSETRVAIAIVVLALVVGEFAARTLEPRLVGRIYDATTTGGYPLSINPDGYRGPLVPTEKKTGTTRILTLGDSASFGTGVPYEVTWPFALVEQLSNSTGRSFDVLSLAAPATELRQIEEGFARFTPTHRPDIAVLLLTGNMVSLEWAHNGRTPDPFLPGPPGREGAVREGALDRLKRLPHAFALPGVLTLGMEYLRLALGMNDHLVLPDSPFGVVFAHGMRQNSMPADRAEEAWSLMGTRLASVRDLARTHGVPLIMSYAPPRFSLSDRLRDNLKLVPTDRFTIDPIERAEALCAELGIPFVRVDPALRAASDDDAPLYVLSDYTHFHEHGHRVIAETVAQSAALQRALGAGTLSNSASR